MTTAIALPPPPGSPVEEYGPRHLRLRPDLPYEEWAAVGETLGRIGRGVQWWIGYWLRYGEHTYGEKYHQAAKLSGYSEQSLLNMQWVVEKFTNSPRGEFVNDCTSRARFDVEWSLYREVAARPEEDQDYWLGRAESEKWSHGDLRREIKQTERLNREALAIEQARARGGGVARVTWQDAVEFLAAQRPASADLILTDPPYATEIADIDAFAAEWLPLALAALKPAGRGYVCTGAYARELRAYTDVLLRQSDFRVGNVLVWTYENTLGPVPADDYKLNWQAIFYVYGPAAPPLNAPAMVEQFTVQRIAAPDGRTTGRLDPWEKPTELAERLIRHSTQPGAIVLDPFAGTGTFVAAAGRLGRRGYGSEIDRGRLELCERRGIEVIRA